VRTCARCRRELRRTGNDLAALSQDILLATKSATVVVAETSTHWSPRCRNAPSPVHNSEVTKDAQGVWWTLSECSLFSLANRTGQTQNILATAAACQLDYMLGPAGFLKYSSTMKHWFVDDDSDHALMRITVPGHLKTHRRLRRR
jgi:hypothetical protein